jgi:hypothetical protein
MARLLVAGRVSGKMRAGSDSKTGHNFPRQQSLLDTAGEPGTIEFFAHGMMIENAG